MNMNTARPLSRFAENCWRVILLFSLTWFAADSLNSPAESQYVEIVSERWNFANTSFAGWPSLPDGLQPNITQLVRGRFNGMKGIWLYCNKHIYFVWENRLTGRSSFAQSLLQFIDLNRIWPSEVTDLFTINGTRIAAATDGSLAAVATPLWVFLFDCLGTSECHVKNKLKPPLGMFGNVESIIIAYTNASMWVGSPVGLWRIDLTRDSVEYVSSQPVVSMAWRSASSRHGKYISCNSGSPLLASRHSTRGMHSDFGSLVVGGGNYMAFYNGHEWWQEWVSNWGARVGGVVDGPVSAMTFDLQGHLWIGNNVSLSRLNNDYTYDRIGPLQGLPYGNITAIVFVPGNENHNGILGDRLWLGTTKGAAVLNVVSGEFYYYYGPRWHPGSSVSAMGWLGENVTVMATSRGLAALRPEVWTLRAKADHYEAMVERHTRDPGLVADCSLTNFVPGSCAPHTTDNDGLWTSLVLASELFRYLVTQSSDAQKKFLKQFAGMKFLNDVTGISGLMARSVVREDVAVSGGKWYKSTTKPGWKWKADTSSDEVVGHMFALPLVHSLLQKDFINESCVAQKLVDTILDYIVRNGFQLIDKSGKHTRWGVWSPTELNTEYSWADERGVNSLQILSYLVSAYRMTRNVTYLETWQMLYNGSYHGLATGYGRNMINQKVTFPLDDNYSDDELAFLPYFTYFYNLKGLAQENILPDWRISEMAQDVKISLERAWRVVGGEGSSLWTTVYFYATDSQDKASLQRMVSNLRNWPLELIQWKVENSHRLDITFNREPDRDGNYNSQSDRVLPANERCQYRWNSNPHQLDDGGSSLEFDPGAWLLPYWMAKWHGDI